jgi:hypothetical protein
MPKFHRDELKSLPAPPRRRLRCDYRLLLILLLPAMALAQSTGGSYVMRKQVIAAGARAQGGVYAMTGTAQQPIAFVQAAGPYRLTGGFHGPGESTDRMFCDGFEDTPCD